MRRYLFCLGVYKNGQSYYYLHTDRYDQYGGAMNKGFELLSEDRQNNIINAGFEVFSVNIYRKAPMIEIASAAKISKSLLFYHFKNKKELYLFLLDKAIEIANVTLENIDKVETENYFELLRHVLKEKSIY